MANCKKCIHNVICSADSYFKSIEDADKHCLHFLSEDDVIRLKKAKKYIQSIQACAEAFDVDLICGVNDLSWLYEVGHAENAKLRKIAEELSKGVK